jgi:hypothetical protein
MNEQNEVYSSKSERSTRVKMKSWRKTVGITLPEDLIERAGNQGSNISKVTENALLSIIDYLETQNTKTSTQFLDQPSFLKKVEAGPTGIEPATYGLRVRRSNLTELRAQLSSGKVEWESIKSFRFVFHGLSING